MLVIAGGLVVTPEGDGVRAERGTIAVEGDRIARVGYGAEGDRLAAGPGDRVIEAGRRLVIPGLVDAHCHAYGALVPGLVDHLPLDIRMPALGAMIEAWEDDDTRVATLLTALRMLRGATTTVLENVLQGLGAADAAIRALLGAGMRALVAPMIGDRPFHDTLPGFRERLPAGHWAHGLGGTPARPDDLVEASLAIARRWDGAEGRLRVGLGPSTPHRATDVLLARVAEASAAHGLFVHTHLLETRPQAVVARRLYGRTMVEHIRALGLLTPRLSCAHAVWLTDGDLDLVAATGAGISHNPLSNLYLGSGIARLPELLRRGIPVGIGSDGPNCGAAGPLFEVMKLAAIVHRIGEPDGGRWPSTRDAFRLATIGGARALGLEAEVGSIEPGKKADLVLLDADAVSLVPLNDAVSQLVYWESGQAVRTVLVDGEVVLDDGRPTRFDAAALLAEARERAARLRERIAPGLARARELDAPLLAAYSDLLGSFPGTSGDPS
jgi:cytosine/adenosine deaminase-related metal-dependent hydrolase